MIETRNLTRRYGGRPVVDGVNLAVGRGEIYGFLGPNGAGKTTTLKMILGLVQPSDGNVVLFGEGGPSDRELRCRIGVVPEVHPQGMWATMTADEYLRFFAELYGVERVAARATELAQRVGLSDAVNRPFSTFSRGMVQRLSIARALIHDPELLVLDEPISGLDAGGVRQVRDLLLEENRRGRTIFVSSHQLTEMEKICDRVGIMHAGKLRAEDRMSTLLEAISPNRQILIELDRLPADLPATVRSLPFVKGVEVNGTVLTVHVDREGDRRMDLSRHFVRNGLVPLRIEERSASLEEAFVTITEERLHDVGFLEGTL